MAINTTQEYSSEMGSWQEVYESTATDRIKSLREKVIELPEVCLEHAFIEMEVRDEIEGKNIPRPIERAMIFERYLQKRTIFIEPGELIVGNINSKHRGSTWVGELYNVFAEQEVGVPGKDPSEREVDPHMISDEERDIILNKIIPYFKGKTFEEYLYSKAEGEVADKAFIFTADCGHIPNTGDLLVRQDAGHTLCNYEKVLRRGLNSIKEEILHYQKETKEAFNSFNRQERLDWYEAALMSVNAVLDHAQRFSKLAMEEAKKEKDPARKAELVEIARIISKVPAEPAETWHEALQSVWFLQCCLYCEQINYAISFGRFDQYMYPYYEKSVKIDKDIDHDYALELLECFWIKTASFTELYDIGTAKVNAGYPVTENLIIGGQTIDGKDACNDVTMLCLEAEEEVGLIQPEIAMRIWEGTPDEYLRKCCEVIRLGRGKPKFYGDRVALKMVENGFPNIDKQYYADYAVVGCVELALPYICQQHSFTGLSNVAKIFELTLNNGKCGCCGKQIGPKTGDPTTFKTFDEFKAAFREQTIYWQKCMGKGMKVEMECQGERLMLPFTSCLLEGPIPKGIDMMQGGCWYTRYGVEVGGTATAGDSLAAIDELVFKTGKVSMEDMIKACNANFEGYEEIRQMCLNETPKYGNDDDVADSYAAFVCDTWYDGIEAMNADPECIPKYGGVYVGSTLIGSGAAGMGGAVSATPDGRLHPMPLSDTFAPVQGADIHGTDAVIKSISKLPAERFEMGTALNQRLHPQMLATDEDITTFMNYIRTAEKLGVFHIQFNIIDSKVLRRAMKDREKYKDLMVRVASYCSYFVDLDPVQQMDIINRTEQVSY